MLQLPEREHVRTTTLVRCLHIRTARRHGRRLAMPLYPHLSCSTRTSALVQPPLALLPSHTERSHPAVLGRRALPEGLSISGTGTTKLPPEKLFRFLLLFAQTRSFVCLVDCWKRRFVGPPPTAHGVTGIACCELENPSSGQRPGSKSSEFAWHRWRRPKQLAWR